MRMQKIGLLCLCLSMILIFGSITMVVGQETEDEMVVPMGTIVLETAGIGRTKAICC